MSSTFWRLSSIRTLRDHFAIYANNRISIRFQILIRYPGTTQHPKASLHHLRCNLNVGLSGRIILHIDLLCQVYNVQQT